MRRARFSLILLVVALAAALGVELFAAEPVLAGLVKPKPTPAAAKANVPTQHMYLIRSTLSALDDANRSGNYSVLRDLAAPSFQLQHSSADLAVVFAEARKAAIDLAPATVTEPIITETVRADAGHLRLTGIIPAAPEHIIFTLQFEAVAGHWKLTTLAIGRQAGTHVDVARK
jgi:hypothetical protein